MFRTKKVQILKIVPEFEKLFFKIEQKTANRKKIVKNQHTQKTELVDSQKLRKPEKKSCVAKLATNGPAHKIAP
jgi:hypothetical protein